MTTADPTAPLKVRLPAALVALFPDAPRLVEVRAGTVAGLMDELDRRWPGMRDRLCDGTPAVRRHINVFVDGERLDLAAAIPPGSDVHVLMAISGG